MRDDERSAPKCHAVVEALRKIGIGAFIPLLLTGMPIWHPSDHRAPASIECGGSQERTPSAHPLRDRAIVELRALVETVRRFRSPEAQARVQAKLADALWAVDEPLARRLFEEAFVATSRIEDDPKEGSRAAREKKYRLRQEIIRRAARRDPALADQLLARLSEADHIDPLRPASERARHRLTSAHDLLRENPQQAIRMVRESLDEGVIDFTLFFLDELRRRDPQQADRLFERALQSVVRRAPPNLNELLLLGSYLFTERTRISFSIIAGRPAVNVMPGLFAREVGSPRLIRRYLDAAFHVLTLMASAPAHRLAPYESGLMAAAIRQLLPFYERYEPERALFLSGVLSQLAPHLPEPLRAQEETPPSESEQLTAALERARKETHPEKRDLMYLRIAYALYTQGRYDAAREVAEKIADPKARAKTISILETAIWRERIAQGIEPPDVRSLNLDLVSESLLIVEWAMALLRKQRTDEAKLLLHGQIARVLADRRERASQWLALAGLLGALRRVDVEEALPLLAGLVRALDLLSENPPPEAPPIEGEQTHLFHFISIGAHRIPFLMPLSEEFQLEKVVEEFARADFEMTLGWMHQIRAEEVRASLIIAACRTALQ